MWEMEDIENNNNNKKKQERETMKKMWRFSRNLTLSSHDYML